MSYRQSFLSIETGASGPNLNTLTQGDNANHLHQHRDGVWVDLPAPLNGWIAYTGVDIPQYMVTSGGFVRFRGAYNGEQAGGGASSFIVDLDPSIIPGEEVNFLVAGTVVGTGVGAIANIDVTDSLRYRTVQGFIPSFFESLVLNPIEYQLDHVRSVLTI